MIDQVEDLDYMLPLALRVSRDTTDIMKIHTPFHAGFGSFFRFPLHGFAKHIDGRHNVQRVATPA